MNRSENITELAAALCKAQAEIEGAEKDAVNPAFRSRYATLGSIWNTVREPLTKHGLCIVQTPTEAQEGHLGLTTTLLHATGQFVSGTIQIPMPKHDPQGYGSALTYARRYGLSAMVGVCADDDDDAESAMPDRTQPPARPQYNARPQVSQPRPAPTAPKVEEDVPPPIVPPPAVEEKELTPLEAAKRIFKRAANEAGLVLNAEVIANVLGITQERAADKVHHRDFSETDYQYLTTYCRTGNKQEEVTKEAKRAERIAKVQAETEREDFDADTAPPLTLIDTSEIANNTPTHNALEAFK